ILLGANHRFGRGRRGDIALLRKLGPELGLEARELTLETLGAGALVSSTAIREAVRDGRLDEAERLLGRPFAVLGDVVHGDARARTTGFPTPTLAPPHEARPPRGVYAVLVAIGGRGVAPAADAPRLLGVANIGRRPTFHPEANEDLVEV